MANLNRVFLIGNLTRDPEQRNAGGTMVCMFGLAINRQFVTNHGEQREETCFVDVDAWGRTAEVVMQFVRKGDPLFVEGRLNYDQWDDRETGKKRSRITVRAERIQLLSNAAAPRGPHPDGMPYGGGYDDAPQASSMQAPRPVGGYGDNGGYGAPVRRQSAPPSGGGYGQQPQQPQRRAAVPQQGYQPQAPMPSFDEAPVPAASAPGDNAPIADDDIPF